jgi:hypothetical protein
MILPDLPPGTGRGGVSPFVAAASTAARTSLVVSAPPHLSRHAWCGRETRASAAGGVVTVVSTSPAPFFPSLLGQQHCHVSWRP